MHLLQCGFLHAHLPRSLAEIRAQVEQGIVRARANYKAEKFIIYFQPNTNTYAPVETPQRNSMTRPSPSARRMSSASPWAPARIASTRPKSPCWKVMPRAWRWTSNSGWNRSTRKRSPSSTALARTSELTALLESLADTPLNLCVHTIFGFPWETRAMMLAHAAEINRFPQIRFVKLHHLHIVKGSILAARYQKEPFPLFELEEYAGFLCEFLPLLRPDIVIQRLFGISDTALLIAPQWNLPKSSIQGYLDREIQRRGVVQGSAC